MKPFLLLATRAEDEAADAEYQAFLNYGGLAPEQLHRVRLESAPLGEVTLDDYSGIITGGGPFNFSDPPLLKTPVQRRVESEIFALLDQVVERDFPFFGACYGVGTLGAHRGAEIDRTFGESPGPVAVELQPAGADDPLLAGVPDSFVAYVGHKEAVRKLSDDAVLLASSAGCPVQMFRVKKNMYATQFHPELDFAGIELRIEVYKEYGYFPAHEAAIVTERARVVQVTHPMRILRNFVERYAQD
ncbi:glutamine amidotransferase [Myceligenerans indicum]|uniref:Glutamine amidotransferase n=1 Tax=Myceligenerans indicum TaxID=2593663 RepID=A0ABS1LM18_9MICO|nr:glutamine amidotransferase [Myceligenerans indicum]MBL0887255.1 glutamine amidotransferase [Myceligenerans indicum]